MSRQATPRARIVVCVVLLAVSGLIGPADAETTDVEVDVRTSEPAGLYGPKGRPPLPGQSPPPRTSAAAPQYFYAGGWDRDLTGSQGALALMKIYRPPRHEPAPGHTLAEMSVESNNRQSIVEVGWTVDHNLYGDWQPRLFVYHWVNGQPTCYNGCGFVENLVCPGVRYVGMPMITADYPEGTTWDFSIRHVGNRWEIAVGLCPIGYFPDSLWNGTFTHPDVVQVFGEVLGREPPYGPPYPCADMGRGTLPTPSGGGVGLHVTRIPNNGTVNLVLIHPTPDLYWAYWDSKTKMRYGGPGAC